jgi:hypothetical protein
VDEITGDQWWCSGLEFHRGRIVCENWDSEEVDQEILYWNGSGVIQLTDNAFTDADPQIHDGQVAWASWNWPEGAKILLWDGAQVFEFPNPGYSSDSEGPQLHDGQIAWSGGTANKEVFVADTRPYAVRSLRFEGTSDLRWNHSMACSAAAYDAIRGDVANLAAVGERIDLGPVVCLESGSPDVAAADGDAPPAGTAWFYLVRSTRYGSYGPASDGSLRRPLSGDCR